MDLQDKNRSSPELEKREIEIQLMRDQLIFDKISIKKREAEIESASYDLQLSEIKERMEMKKRQIKYLEDKLGRP